MNTQNISEIAEDEIDLLMFVRRLWHGKFFILLVMFVTGSIGFVVAFGTPSTYRADALLQLEEKSGQLALPDGLAGLTDSAPTSATEIEILKSRKVMGQAAAREHLDWVVRPEQAPQVLNAAFRLNLPLPDWKILRKYVRPTEYLTVDYLEVPPDWLSTPVKLSVEHNSGFTLTLPDDRPLAGIPGEMLRDPQTGLALQLGEVQAEPGRVFYIIQQSEDVTIDRLRSRFSVSERGRGTNVLELAVTSFDRDAAAKELRAITASYLEQSIARSAAEAQSSLDFIETQLPKAEDEVRQAETALNNFRSEQTAIDLSFEAQSVLTQITTLESDLRQLEAEEEVLAEKYTPNHPTYRQLLNEKARLGTRLDELRNKVSALPETQREVVNLTRNLELAQQVYVQLRNRAQELQVLKASSIGNVRVIDPARTSRFPVAPSRSRILTLSLLFGGILGSGIVLVREMLRRGIQDAQDIEATGLPVFGTINFAPSSAGHRKAKGDIPLHVLNHENDPITEGFKSLRTSLHFGMLDSDAKTVAVTGPSPNLGKSFISANLGAVAAQSGQRVCLIDADMRMGYLRRYFNVPKVHLGLSDVLADNANLDDVLIKTSIDGLFLLPSGKYPPNPSELLMRKTFKETLDELGKRFDLTIIDTPPVLAVTDPLIISSAVASTLLVVRFGETQVTEIEAAQQQYLQAGLHFSGAIFNGFNPKRVSSGRYGGGYHYGYRYAYGENAK
ncbi:MULTISPECIES: polysaccharide biosynthesis tyrosine autokinase [Pseudomonadota]|uniref:polysaccharide biosynthesis tyrosine autokinase n=1 Tax=Pseudomonadota TaxID=1224 RepID=UPI003A939C4B